MRIAGLALTAVGFLAGALVAVMDPDRVDLRWFLPALGLAVVGVSLARLAARREARDVGKLERSFAALDDALTRIVEHARALEQDKDALDIYDLPAALDARFPADIERFVEARTSIMHIWGSKAYADVMSPFAAGERYLNRVWSTAADGYVDEAHAYLTRARQQLEAALAAFEALPHDQRDQRTSQRDAV